MSNSYSRTFFGLIASCALSIMAFTWLIDPFSLYPSPRIHGVNADKSEFLKYLRLTKPYTVYFSKPDAVILGTSRSGRGLSAIDAAWQGENVYNLALPAGSMYENYRLLQHARAAHLLRRVLIGLDFRLFNEAGLNPAFSEGRMLVTRDGEPSPEFVRTLLSDLLASLLSSTAIKASIDTLHHQGWNAEHLLEKGRWDRTRLPYDHRQAFKAYTRQTIQRMAAVAGPLRGLEDYRRFLRLAQREDIELIPILSPSHAAHWILLEKLGLWPRFERLKRELVRINEEVALETGRPPFRLWDFSGVNAYSTEPIPPPGEPAKRMRWFWESVHYQAALGSKVLQRVLSGEQGTADGDDFGVVLTSANLNAHLSAQRRRLKALIEEGGASVELVNAVLAARR